MKPLVPLVLSLCLSFLVASCSTSTPFVKGPDLADLDPALLQDCADPVLLPDRDLTLPEGTEGWATDRSSLVYCRDSKKALVSTILAERGLLLVEKPSSKK